MGRKLLLYLSGIGHPWNVPVASTLAWLTRSKNCLFDNYYDSYHQGVHFPGGDPRNLETGQLTGGTVCGDRHIEEFYFMINNFDVSVVCTGKTIFTSVIRNLGIPVIALADRISVLYRKAFQYFDVPLPETVLMIGSDFGKELSGLDAYLYPEIFYRQAVGVCDSIDEDDLAGLCQKGSKILCLYVKDDVISRLSGLGYEIEIIDLLQKGDNYMNVTSRLARRWKERAEGWIVGDPLLALHWVPTACEENLISLYGVPQEKIIAEQGDLISSKGKVVYGRQYSDKDFFELSKLDQCLQVIDPCRPPFQSVKHTEYNWQTDQGNSGFYGHEYSDDELRQFAGEGRTLISLMFWSGMIRETANFYNLMDLFAITKLRCGLVLTSQSYEYMMHAPLELLTIPLEQGGVYPMVEPVLGSCGVGVGIESSMTPERLKENLEDGLARILRKVKMENCVPRGWWPTMDADLEKLDSRKGPKPVNILKYPPYVQFRFDEKLLGEKTDIDTGDGNADGAAGGRFIDSARKFARRFGLSKYFNPYRPFEFYGAGPIKRDIVNTVKSAGLKYMFTKAGFNSYPEVQYMDEDFIALNYTAGQWDGWTPFETVNDVSDLRKAEGNLIKKGKPGWIVSTIDSCLWTFSGEFWKRGSKLYEIARFCSEGGTSQKLINAKPFTVARYARIISEKNI